MGTSKRKEWKFRTDHSTGCFGIVGKTERTSVGEAFEAWPCFFCRDAAKLEDLVGLVDGMISMGRKEDMVATDLGKLIYLVFALQ